MFPFLSLTILFEFLLQYTLTYISIPLKKYNNNETKNILTNSTIEDDWLYQILYNPISIGNPKQNVLLIISSNEYGLYMFMKDKQFKPDNNSQNYYNYNLRSSSTNRIEIPETTVEYCYISDNFFFDSDNGEKETKNINFIYYLKEKNILDIFNSSVNTIIKAGLKLPESYETLEYGLSLAVQLKGKNITNNYHWFINYNHENNTYLLIIGAEPHEVYPKYNFDNLRLANSITSSYYVVWGIKFYNIYYYDNKENLVFEIKDDINKGNENLLSADFDHSSSFITAPKEYLESIKTNFFNEYINNSVCFIKTNDYNIIYCDMNLIENKENFKSKFKNLYFKHRLFNYTFELTFEDLFIEYDNKYLFLVRTDKFYNSWKFGIPFLKKYLFTFDYDAKTIGFYSEYDSPKEKKSTLKLIILTITIIVLLIAFGLSGFFLGKKIYDNRKKRANELDEEYEYKTQKEEDNEDKANWPILNK